jgi:hypothetical protein
MMIKTQLSSKVTSILRAKGREGLPHNIDRVLADLQEKERRFKNEEVQHPDQDCLSAMWAL